MDNMPLTVPVARFMMISPAGPVFLILSNPDL